ncbi:MAG TPA: alpha-2-macroglobulin family protein, partial [Polyangia bacterium]
MRKPLVFLCLLVGCNAPSVQAKESPVMHEADKLFEAGRYDSALGKYDALAKSAPDERQYARAMFRAVECETLLAQHEHALDRVRAAKLPSDPGLRAIVELARLEMFRGVESWYGFPEETEEGAQGSAKLSKPMVAREMETAAAALWKDRVALARTPLKQYAEFFVLTDADLQRYPSLWDFAVLRMSEWLRGLKGRAAPAPFAAEDYSRSFAPELPGLARLGALYDESAHLAGSGVDRGVAGERWRVARVMLGESAGGNKKDRQAWHDAALARLVEWSKQLHTALGRGEAALRAAGLLYATDRVRALAIVDDILPKTPESDVAVELRQLRHNILDKELGLSTRVTRDGKHALHMSTRNLQTAHFRLYRMDPMRDGGGEFWSQSLLSPRYDRVPAWMSDRKPVAEWKVATGDKGDHMDVGRDVDAAAPGVGLYLVVVSADNAFAYKHSIMRAAYVNVTDLAIARAETATGLRYYAFDVDGKSPAAGIPFRMLVSEDWRTRSADEAKTGADGVATWSFPRAPYLQVDAMAVHGKAIALFTSPAYHGQRTPDPPLELFLASDRPIYRPGQTAKLRVTSVERVKDGSFKIDAHRKIHLVLRDPNGKDAWHVDLVTGAMGSASTEVKLPEKGLLGAFSVDATAPGMRDVSRSLSLRVEEYKRPEFEVTLDAPKNAAKYGEKTKLEGHVKYYFGGAAGDVPVKFKVSRRRWIPWWYWRQGQSPTVEIARGDLKTDKSGLFSVEFAAIPDPDSVPSDDPDMPDVSDYIVEVEAHDAGGRTISADRSLRVGAQALLVSAEAERAFFISDEAPALKIKATNLEEQPVAAKVTWELERLGAPPSKDGKPGGEGEPLQAVLKKYPTAEPHVAHGVATLDGKSPAAIALPQLAAGGYRVRLSAPDGARGAFSFLVADAKTRALPLAIPPTALVQKSEYQPGDRAQLLVGGGAASGTYHLELWRGATLIEHRVERGATARVWTVPVEAKETGGFTARWIGVDGMDAVGGNVTVNVPRKDKALTVKLVGKPDALEPGQSARWSVEVKDEKGRAVDGEALVTIFDRSLELYAKQYHYWADALWAPPGGPPGRADGAQTGWGMALPADEAEAERAQREIQGHYQPKQTPRFSWEETQYNYRYGFGGGHAMRGAMNMPGAPPPPAMAAPMAQAETVATKKSERRREAGKDRDGDGIPDAEDKAEGGEDGRMGKADKGNAPPPSDLRTNMAETAAWIPDVALAGGKGTFSFTAPERLTSWRVQILALGRMVEAGIGDDTFATKKPLMVRVEIPRFFREGDRSTIVAVVHNETNGPLSANVDLDIVDDATSHSGLEALGIKQKSIRVDVPAHGLAPAEFAIVAPENIATYKIRASATAGKLHDAEERGLPILPSRERLVQSRVVALHGSETKTIEFSELLHSKDPSLRSESMSVSIDPELALSVLRSIPFL